MTSTTEAALINTPEMMFFTMLAVLFLGTIIAKITRVPSIIALIIGGVIVGPDCLNILPLNDTTVSFATIGLIFLMFTVGLEIDLSQFQFYRKRAIIFFLLTYLIPQFSGFVIGPILGLTIASSVLLGAIYASYTLVAYPIASKLGILKNEAVGISTCANVFSDITALFILAIVLHIHAGNFTLKSLVGLATMIAICSVSILLFIPYLGRLFFRFFSDGKINFPFVLLVLFASSTIAHDVGMNAIIGAFLGGLAVNRMVTRESRVFRQALFTADTIFIPLFLITIGIRIDLDKIFSSWNVLIVGLTLTATVYITKFAAAWIATRLFNYSRAQMWTIWGLTQAQAAATLAIILVGTRAGLFTDTLLQGSIIMVLFTLVSSPIIVKYFGSQLTHSQTTKKRLPLLQTIMVPVNSDQFPENTLELAARLARYGKGKLMILNLANSAENLESRREILRAGPLKETGTTVELTNRIHEAQSNLSAEILKETIESEVSLVMLNWENNESDKGPLFSNEIDETIWSSPRPVAVVSLKNPIKSFKRAIVVIGEHKKGIRLNKEFPKITETISKALDIPLTIMAKAHYLEHFESNKAQLFNLKTSGLIPNLAWFHSKKAKLFKMHLKDFKPNLAWLRKKDKLTGAGKLKFISVTNDLIKTALSEIKKDDLVIIPTMGSQDRFEKNPDLLAYNLWTKSEASLIILKVT